MLVPWRDEPQNNDGTVDPNRLIILIKFYQVINAIFVSSWHSGSEIVAVTLPALCEFVWVLARGYRREAREIIGAIRHLVDSATVSADRPAVDVGLAVMAGGGDFADGVIAFEGRRLGGTFFASFDRTATELIAATGGETHLLPDP